MTQAEVLSKLRRIAERASRPTMQYSPENELREQRESLDWIAHEAGSTIRDMLLTVPLNLTVTPAPPLNGRQRLRIRDEIRLVTGEPSVDV